MNEDDCFSLLLSQRECSALKQEIDSAKSKAEASAILNRHGTYHGLSEEDLLTEFPGLAKTVQELPDDSSPVPDP
ncbi:hypothetical protein ACIQFU_02010 [Streptomyces sp. NPDC093065]|uniref:hypothetical protein n=1 Tax=Streptomyces sp. NPDC093065 TaxID=3366021 RepID=UPI00381A8896